MPISVSEYTYPFDPSGTAETNKVENEVHIITPVSHQDYNFIIPKFAPFFGPGLSLAFTDIAGNEVPLAEGVDYYLSHHFIAGSRACAKQLYGSISILNRTFSGVLKLKKYQTIGGMWTYDESYLLELLTNIQINPRISSWDSIVLLPASFPVIDHEWDLVDMVGMNDVAVAIVTLADTIADPEGGGGGAASMISAHIADTTNPHRTNKLQVGLGDVENYAVATKAEAEVGALNTRYVTPLRVKEAILALAVALLDAHKLDTNNPHSTTKAHVGLGNVPNYAVATPVETLAGMINTAFITPALLALYIADKVGTDVPGHVADLTNPHEVNAAQVGAYSIAEINNLLLGKLAATATAANSAKLENQTLAQITASILQGKAATSGNSEALEGNTLAEVLALAASQTVGNAVTFSGYTFAELMTAITESATSANSNLLGNQLPAFYAPQTSLDAANERIDVLEADLTATMDRVTVLETDLGNLLTNLAGILNP